MSRLIPSGPLVSLIVVKLEASLDYYVRVLGFDLLGRGEAPGGFSQAAHVRWPSGLHLWLLQDRRHRRPLEGRGGGLALYFPVSGSLARWRAERSPTDIIMVEDITARAGGFSDLTLADPDWYRLVFYGSE